MALARLPKGPRPSLKYVRALGVTPVAGVPPKLTDVAPVKFKPLMVTDVPPEVGPTSGVASSTDGGKVGR